MSNNSNNDRDRNRSGYNRGWGNDVSRNYESQNFGNEGRYGSRYVQNRGDWDNYNDYRGDNDWDDNRGMYGNQGNRGGNYSSRENYGNSRGNEYGRERYGYDRGQNENRDWWDKTKDEVSSWFGDEDAERRRRVDERQGQHRGKGPKGYTRSDDRIKEDVNDRLSDDSHIDASDIDVVVNNCEVTLTGTVTNRWEKRHAEDLAESVSGVKNVENRLKIAAGNMADSGTGAAGTSYVSGKANPITAYESSKS